MDRPDGRRRGRETAPARQDPPQAEEEPNSDITGAFRQAQAGSHAAGAALDAKTKRTAIVVVVALVAFSLLNLAGNVYLYQRATNEAVAQAEANRLNGAAQEQARRALEDAGPANDRLRAMGLFPIQISPPNQSPASETIANSASAQVLADMPREAIVGEDYVALGQAVARFYQRQPTITQSGPTPLKVQQLGQQYLRVAAQLSEQGQLPAPRR